MLLIEYVCFGCDKHCTCLIQPIPLRPEGCILNQKIDAHWKNVGWYGGPIKVNTGGLKK